MGTLTLYPSNDLNSSNHESNRLIDIAASLVSFVGIFLLIAIFVVLVEKM